MRTHTLPPYPPISVRLNESGTTLMEVHITTEGNVDDCKDRAEFQFRAPRYRRLRICEIQMALAAPDQRGRACCRFHPRFGQMGPQGRQIIKPISRNSSVYHGVEK